MRRVIASESWRRCEITILSTTDNLAAQGQRQRAKICEVWARDEAVKPALSIRSV
jgi:hypothetical protein